MTLFVALLVFHLSFSLFTTLLQETLHKISIELFVLQLLISFPAKKVRVKACNRGKNVVSLHRQSKETPYVPDNGHLLRPRRGINDGRRRSSMTTPKRTRNGAIRGVAKMNLLTQTTMINYSIIMRSVNANLLAIVLFCGIEFLI